MHNDTDATLKRCKQCHERVCSKCGKHQRTIPAPDAHLDCTCVAEEVVCTTTQMPR